MFGKISIGFFRDFRAGAKTTFGTGADL